MKNPFLVGMALGILVPTFGMILRTERGDVLAWMLVVIYAGLAVLAWSYSMLLP